MKVRLLEKTLMFLLTAAIVGAAAARYVPWLSSASAPIDSKNSTAPSLEEVFKNGFSWEPFQQVFYVGDTIRIRRTHATSETAAHFTPKYRLLVKKGIDGPWETAREFAEEPPAYQFTNPGVYGLQVSEKRNEKIIETWLGQFFVSEESYRATQCSLLPTICAHHFSPAQFSDPPTYNKKVAQECLIVLLSLYQQYKGQSTDEILSIAGQFAGSGIKLSKCPSSSESNLMLAVTASQFKEEIRIDLARNTVTIGSVMYSYPLDAYPGLRDVFQITENEPQEVAIAAACTYLAHCGAALNLVPLRKIQMGYPELVAVLKDCAMWQQALHSLLAGMGFDAVKVAVTYNGGAIHAFNEIECGQGEGRRKYTLDATASSYFKGVVEDLSSNTNVAFLPATTNLGRVLWDQAGKASIKKDNITIVRRVP